MQRKNNALLIGHSAGYELTSAENFKRNAED